MDKRRDAATGLAKAGSAEQKRIEKLATAMNEAIPENTDAGLVFGALMLLLRIGFDHTFEDEKQRMEVYDELVNGNRALMMKDAGIPGQ